MVGVACSEANSIRVVVQRPTDAVGRLDCSTPYLDRMKILKVPTLLNTLKNVYSEQNFGSAITSDILDPVNAVINGIINARNTNSIAELAVKEINRLRAELAGKYYKNPNIDPKHYQSFLELDEAMELIVLELIRCVDKNADSNLFQEVNAFFNESSTINSEYSVTPRNIIDKSYVTNYTPIVSGIKTKADTIFDSTKKQ